MPTPPPPPPYNLADALPSVRRLHATVTRVQTAPAFYLNSDQISPTLCLWCPIWVFRVGSLFPDGAALLGASATVGPTDPNGLLGGEIFGNAAGRGGAVVLSVNGPHKVEKTPDQLPIIEEHFVTPMATAGLGGSNVGNLAGQVLTKYGIVDYWPCTPPDGTDKASPKSRATDQYAPASIPLRTSDIVALSFLVNPFTTENQDSATYALSADIKLSFLIRGDASIYTRG